MPLVRVPLDQPLLLGPSLTGGQAFRWRRLPGGTEAFAGVAEGHAWTVARLDGALLVEAFPELPSRAMVAWARRYFRLDDDYLGLGHRLRAQPELAPAVEAWWGLRLLRTDPWECLVSFVTSIHDSVAAIETRLARLGRAFGEPVRAPAPHFPRGWTHALPTPERLARAQEARLRDAAGMGFRAPYLRNAAKAVVRGDLPLAQLAAMPYAEAHEVLLQVDGVGDKVADCVQLFGLGHLEAFPVDRWIHRALVQRYFGGDATTKPKALVPFAQARWGRDAGYAQQFLFHHDRLAASASRGRGRSGAPSPAGTLPRALAEPTTL